MVNDYEPLVSKQPKEKNDDFMKELDDRRENLADDLFLEHVFLDGKPYLPRQEWEKNVLTGVKWIFDSTLLRKEVYDYIEREV